MTLITAIALLTILVVFVALHVARNRAIGGAPASQRCPRCHAPIPEGAGFCSR